MLQGNSDAEERDCMDEDLERLTDRLRRGREAIERALSETMSGRTEDLVKKISDLRERIEKRISHADEERPKNR
jgi:hypothetical protein